MFYIIVVLLTLLTVSLLNCAFVTSFTAGAFFTVLAHSAFMAVAAFIIDGITALIVRRLFPEKLFAPLARVYDVGKKESAFYRFIRVKSWKDKVPELGGFTSFHKDRLASSNDPEYLKSFLVESNYGYVIHLVNGIFGFLILLIPIPYRLSISLPVAGVNLFLSLLPVAILRSNTPMLRRLYKRALKKASTPSV